MSTRKLLLLDGHSLAYRAFFALPTDLATAAGTVTNAVYGFTSMLTKVLADEHPELIAVAFDAPGRTFRDDMDADYKAGRATTPDLFKSQLPLIREVLTALNIKMIDESGVEADDVIATLATQAAAVGIDVVIVTGDRDSYQLVQDPHIKVLYNRRGVSDYALYDEAGIFERTGVTPVQYPEYAALRGDPSDNLPGIPGIGEKTAAKLVAAYGNLEGIFEHLDELPPKQRQNLGEGRDRVFKNREMSILRREVPLDVGPEDFSPGTVDREQLRVLFNQLEFRSLLPRILEALGDVDEEDAVEVEGFEVDVRTLHDAKEAAAYLAGLAKAGERIALDGRWAGPPGRSMLLGLGAATKPDLAVYVPFETLADAGVRDALTHLVGPEGPPLVAHRAKELAHGLGELDLRSLESDTAVMAYLLDPAEGKYLLDDLALRYLSVELRSPDAVEGTLDLDGDQENERTGRQVAALLLLAEKLREALEARELVELYERFEQPLVRVLARMEAAGIAIDLKFLE
ncbi:MAG: polymerase, partial [Actinomycetota bacterium]|nr:polymerase [Actinomycetota bacterium]